MECGENDCTSGLGNWLAEVDEPPVEAGAVLRDALEDEEPLVREHAAWALERIGTEEARGALEARFVAEEGGSVRGS